MLRNVCVDTLKIKYARAMKFLRSEPQGRLHLEKIQFQLSSHNWYENADIFKNTYCLAHCFISIFFYCSFKYIKYGKKMFQLDHGHLRIISNITLLPYYLIPIIQESKEPLKIIPLRSPSNWFCSFQTTKSQRLSLSRDCVDLFRTHLLEVY